MKFESFIPVEINPILSAPVPKNPEYHEFQGIS